jgi:hypothetical protein
LSSQPPSVFVALLRTAARSLPASGSDQACAQMSSARAMRGRIRSRCSAVPNANNVDASSAMPLALTRAGASAA